MLVLLAVLALQYFVCRKIASSNMPRGLGRCGGARAKLIRPHYFTGILRLYNLNFTFVECS
jgi:hypothetical protein